MLPWRSLSFPQFKLQEYNSGCPGGACHSPNSNYRNILRAALTELVIPPIQTTGILIGLCNGGFYTYWLIQEYTSGCPGGACHSPNSNYKNILRAALAELVIPPIQTTGIYFGLLWQSLSFPQFKLQEYTSGCPGGACHSPIQTTGIYFGLPWRSLWFPHSNYRNILRAALAELVIPPIQTTGIYFGPPWRSLSFPPFKLQEYTSGCLDAACHCPIQTTGMYLTLSNTRFLTYPIHQYHSTLHDLSH
jgi:hypothetical protein